MLLFYQNAAKTAAPSPCLQLFKESHQNLNRQQSRPGIYFRGYLDLDFHLILQQPGLKHSGSRAHCTQPFSGYRPAGLKVISIR
jgi:hypothetical protein